MKLFVFLEVIVKVFIMENLFCLLCDESLKYSVVLACCHSLCYSCANGLIISQISLSKEVINI